MKNLVAVWSATRFYLLIPQQIRNKRLVSTTYFQGIRDVGLRLKKAEVSVIY